MRNRLEQNLEPKESLELMKKALKEAKTGFESENFSFIFWGVVLIVIMLGHYIVSSYGMPQAANTVYWLLPICTCFYVYYFFGRRRRTTSHYMGLTIRRIWFLLGVNVLVVGNHDASTGQAILFFLPIGLVITGLLVRSRVFTLGGVLSNVLALVAHYSGLEQYATLWVSGVAFLGLLLPGLIMRYQHNSKQ